MKGLVGHEAVVDSLPSPLPQTLLLVGPEGVGKSRAAWLIAKTKTDARGLDFQNLRSLNRDAARRMLAHHATYPLESTVKVSTADISESSREALNSILKLLEEPPAYSRIVLTSDVEPPLTIRSRCFVLRFGTLTRPEVATVLKKLNVNAPEEAAEFSHGRVSLGLEYARSTAARNVTGGVLEAVSRQDASAVERALNVALRGDSALPREQVEVRRGVVCRLLSQSIRSSLTKPDHPLAKIPLTSRLRALDVLDSAARPNLRARSAVWLMLAD